MLRNFVFRGVVSGLALTSFAYGTSSSSCTSGSAIAASNNVTRPAPPIKNVSLKNKTVLITGATAGIGLACAWRFAESGANLVLVGRREERLQAIKNLLAEDFPNVRVHTVAMSVADTAAVAALPTSLPEDFQHVDILVNNAGLALGVTSVQDNSVADAATVLETNVLGIVAMCSAFLPGMLARDYGHIINIGSVAGHHAYTTGSVYNASKYAVHGFTSAARHDLGATPVRVTHISPGLVGETEFSNVRLRDDNRAKGVYADMVPLAPQDVADNVIYAATRPPHVQIADIVMYSTNQSGPRDTYRVGPNLGAKQQQKQ